MFGRLGLSLSSSLNVTCLDPTGITYAWLWQEVCSCDTIFPANLLLSGMVCWNLCLSNVRVCLLFIWGTLDQEPWWWWWWWWAFNIVPQKKISPYCCALSPQNQFCCPESSYLQADFSLLNAKKLDKSLVFFVLLSQSQKIFLTFLFNLLITIFLYSFNNRKPMNKNFI